MKNNKNKYVLAILIFARMITGAPGSESSLNIGDLKPQEGGASGLIKVYSLEGNVLHTAQRYPGITIHDLGINPDDPKFGSGWILMNEEVLPYFSRNVIPAKTQIIQWVKTNLTIPIQRETEYYRGEAKDYYTVNCNFDLPTRDETWPEEDIEVLKNAVRLCKQIGFQVKNITPQFVKTLRVDLIQVPLDDGTTFGFFYDEYQHLGIVCEMGTRELISKDGPLNPLIFKFDSSLNPSLS